MLACVFAHACMCVCVGGREMTTPTHKRNNEPAWDKIKTESNEDRKTFFKKSIKKMSWNIEINSLTLKL